MSWTSYPPGTSSTIATRSRSEAASDIPRTSLDMEGVPHRSDPSPEAFNLGWFVFSIMMVLLATGVLIAVFRNLH